MGWGNIKKMNVFTCARKFVPDFTVATLPIRYLTFAGTVPRDVTPTAPHELAGYLPAMEARRLVAIERIILRRVVASFPFFPPAPIRNPTTVGLVVP